jgi:hypothetical protein
MYDVGNILHISKKKKEKRKEITKKQPSRLLNMCVDTHQIKRCLNKKQLLLTKFFAKLIAIYYALPNGRCC